MGKLNVKIKQQDYMRCDTYYGMHSPLHHLLYPKELTGILHLTFKRPRRDC